MAQELLTTGLNKVKETLSGGTESTKIAQLAADTSDVMDKNARIASDYGVLQNNTDDWLKVHSEDRTG